METRGLLKIIILVLLCLLVQIFTSNGQAIYSKGASIMVLSGTSLSVNGSFENEGILTNDGHMKVSGAWVNAGIYHPANGQVTFNSSSASLPQVIHHNGQAISRLTLAGGTRKVILSDLVVSRWIEFIDGVIEGSAGSTVILEDDAEVVGASDRSHIYGRVAAAGGGRKRFPLGNGALYLPVELTDVAEGSAPVAIEVSEFQNVSLSPGPSIRRVSDERYWQIDAEPGSLDNSRIVLPLRAESFSGSGKVVVVQSESASARFSSIGGSVVNDGQPVAAVVSEHSVTMPFVALATSAENDLVVYNAVSPNGDGRNDFMRIENIESYPHNRLSVYNRWGDKVFEIQGYNNDDRSFKGKGNLNGEKALVTGTYYYVLDLPERESIKGFLTLKQ